MRYYTEGIQILCSQFNIRAQTPQMSWEGSVCRPLRCSKLPKTAGTYESVLQAKSLGGGGVSEE